MPVLPNANPLLRFAALGAVAALGHTLMATALRYIPVVLITPLQYLKIVSATRLDGSSTGISRFLSPGATSPSPWPRASTSTGGRPVIKGIPQSRPGLRRSVIRVDGLTGRGRPPRNPVAWARSSVGEHYVDIVGVGGSIPPAPTTAPSRRTRCHLLVGRDSRRCSESRKRVPRDGIEPPTRGFSVPCSTD